MQYLDLLYGLFLNADIYSFFFIVGFYKKLINYRFLNRYTKQLHLIAFTP